MEDIASKQFCLINSEIFKINVEITEIFYFYRLNEKKLNENADQISPLQSWGPEIRNFKKLSRKPIKEGDCDIIIEKPTYILKIDAGTMID